MIRELTIRPVLNGYIVTVGCQKVVFNSAQELCQELMMYLRQPLAQEEKYLKESVNKDLVKRCEGPGPTTDTGELSVERARGQPDQALTAINQQIGSQPSIR